MKRFLFSMVPILVLAIILVLKSDQGGPYDASNQSVNLAQRTDVAALGSSGVVKRVNVNYHPLSFVDQISGTPINPSKIELLSKQGADRPSALVSAQSITIGDAKSISGVWTYSRMSTNGEIIFEIPLGKGWDAEEAVALPWTSSVVYSPISLVGKNVNGGVAEISFPNEEKWATVMNGQVPGKDVFSPSRSMATRLTVYDDNFEDLEWIRLTEEDGWYKAEELPFSGVGLIKFQHPDYGISTQWIDVSYGEVARLEHLLIARPIFQGQVVDQSGKGVGNAKVLVDVRLDPEAHEASLLPTDGDHGRIAFGTEGNYSYVIKRGVITDSDGFFSVDCPAGLAFALEAFSADRKAYAFLEVVPTTLGEAVVPVELVLVRKQAWGPRIKCLSPEGREVYGIEFSFMIGDDPWARGLPTVTTTEEFTTHYPWLPDQPATLGIRMKSHPEWKKASGVFLVDYDGNPNSTIIINLAPKTTN